jgi:hypothetical protein
MLFREFQAQLGDDYIVMHSVAWLSRNRKRNFDGEADFVIVHPNHGLLVLEVKGGAIEGEWSADTWTSTGHNERRNEIRNPIKQAYDSMYALKAKLADDPRTTGYSWPLFRGVAFPDTLVEGVNFGPDFERSLVIDSSDLGTLDQAVRRMFSPQSLPQPLKPDLIQGVLDLLQPVVQITQVGLLAELKQGEAVMTQLTEQQYRLLGFLRHHRQVVVNGCAGSGKTMLAVEKARLLAEQGFAVLLTCFNKNLADWMRSGIDHLDPDVRNRIVVRHYHDLAVTLLDEAGRPTVVRSGDAVYWTTDLPAEFVDALPSITQRFDAVIADEGQDFTGAWWNTLRLLLRDPDQGVFYVFQDEQQAIYRREFNLPFRVAPHELSLNCRSTAHIHKKVIEYYGGNPKPESLGPAGRSIEAIVTEDEGLHATVGAVLERLLHLEGIGAGQVVVLTPNSARRSRLKPGDRVGEFTLTWDLAPTGDEIRVSGVHAFKGLESDVVILAEPEHFGRQRYADELMYVALSRAKHHLIVLGTLPVPKRAATA